MKVFSFYPLVGNLVNFKVQRISNTNTHHLCRYIILDILLKCGVLFICTWAYQSLLPDKLTTPHFLFLIPSIRSWLGKNVIDMAYKMNPLTYNLFGSLPDEQGTDQQSRKVLERLLAIGIRAKKQELEGYSQTIFLYRDMFLPMGTSLSNPTLINFLKSEFNIQ